MLSLTNVSKTFLTPSGPLAVLKEINLALAQGESLSIVGPSGSGKSTLLALAAGLDTASGGEIHLCGQPIQKLDKARRAQLRRTAVGFIFQNFQLLPTFTARENVALPLEFLGRSEALQHATDWLHRVGLKGREDHYPKQLSGGEQQRVALARAFIKEPQIIFCDEPTGCLDADTASYVAKLIFSFCQDWRTTLVVVTHNQELAARCLRQAKLRNGSLISDRLFAPPDCSNAALA